MPAGKTESGLRKIWFQFRKSLARYRAAIGARDDALAQQREWLGDLRGKRVLEIGCGEGSLLTLEIAGAAEEYIGVDLQASRICKLQAKLEACSLKNARVIQGDIFEMSRSLGQFDVIYSCSVLHAFPDIDTAARRLRKLLRPNGRLIAWEPMNTGLAVRFARGLYRPFQPDRRFHYPLTGGDIRKWEAHFTLAGIRGLLCWSKWGFPIYMIPGGQKLGVRIGRWLRKWDLRKKNVRGCHQVLLLLVARSEKDSNFSE